MKEKVIKNLQASVRAKLLNYAKVTNENYNAVLNRFFQERFLARLSKTKYKEHFILKGGLLLLTEHVSTFRPTIDIDLLGVNIDNSFKTIEAVVKKICDITLEDGIQFNSDDLSIQTLKENVEYEGLRFRLPVFLGKLRSRIQIDIGFGDAVPAGFEEKSLPTILSEFKVPDLLIYPLESVISEKFQAIVYLGETNSRMKDFYDILFLASNNSFSSGKLRKAIEATFHKRETDIARRLFIYQNQYIELKSGLWRIFMSKIQSNEKSEFSNIISKINAFIEPVLKDNNLKADWNPEKWEWLNL